MAMTSSPRFFFTVAFCLLLLGGCAGTAEEGAKEQQTQEKNTKKQRASKDEQNPLTHGNVQLRLKVGKTTQTEILEGFGAPNITSIDGEGREVWTYRRIASVSKSRQEGGGVFLGLGAASSSSSGFSSTQRTTTLIIKFDENKVVSDFKSRSSAF